jgi:hypothetical protein
MTTTYRQALDIAQRIQREADAALIEDDWIGRIEEIAVYWDALTRGRPIGRVDLYGIGEWLAGARWATPMHTAQYRTLRELGEVVEAIKVGVRCRDL